MNIFIIQKRTNNTDPDSGALSIKGRHSLCLGIYLYLWEMQKNCLDFCDFGPIFKVTGG